MCEDAHLSNLQISPSILVFINANGQRLRIYLLEAHVKYDVEYITSRLKKKPRKTIAIKTMRKQHTCSL